MVNTYLPQEVFTLLQNIHHIVSTCVWLRALCLLTWTSNIIEWMFPVWIRFWVQYSLLFQYEILEKLVTSILGVTCTKNLTGNIPHPCSWLFGFKSQIRSLKASIVFVFVVLIHSFVVKKSTVKLIALPILLLYIKQDLLATVFKKVERKIFFYKTVNQSSDPSRGFVISSLR